VRRKIANFESRRRDINAGKLGSRNHRHQGPISYISEGITGKGGERLQCRFRRFVKDDDRDNRSVSRRRSPLSSTPGRCTGHGIAPDVVDKWLEGYQRGKEGEGGRREDSGAGQKKAGLTGAAREIFPRIQRRLSALTAYLTSVEGREGGRERCS
jgi:hypothetical protein